MISNNNTDASGLPIGLADRMAYYGAPTNQADGTEGNGWAANVAQKVYAREKDANGNYVLDANGNFVYSTTDYQTYYRMEPIQEIIEYAGTVLTKMMIATKNDSNLQNIKWTQAQGTSVSSDTDSSTPSPAATPSLETLGTLELQEANWNASMTKSGFNDGMQSQLTLVNSSLKQVHINIQNSYIRYLGIYISFFDADGNVMDTSNVTLDGVPNKKWWPNNEDWSFMTSTTGSTLGLESNTMRFVDTVGPINTIMAVPTDPKGETDIYITFPEGATSAKIYGCGIGTGQNTYPKACTIGGVMTGICNLALPSFLLGFAVAAQSYKPLYKIVNDKGVVALMVTAGVMYYDVVFSEAAANKKMNWGALSSLGQILFTTGCSKALAWAEKQMAEGEIEDEIPFSGWIMVAINIATTVAQLAETITEVATSPWHIDNTISTTINSEVTLHHDPRSQGWPIVPAGSTATCVGKMIFKNQSRPVVSKTMTLTADDLNKATFVFDFPSNTLGGEVKFEADFYIDDWLAGKAYTSFMENNEADTAEVSLYLVEIPVPLNSESIYSPAYLLTNQDDQLVWEESTDAPTGTILDANNANSGNAISKWVGLSLSQRYGGLGLSWKSFGTGLSDASTGASNTQLYAFQNVDIPESSTNNAKFTDYGFTGQAMLVYDVYPPSFKMTADGQWELDSNGKLIPDPDSVNLGDYYLDPRKANNSIFDGGDGGYHLRKVDITGTTNFDPNDPNLLSHGRFPYFPDHLAIHPSGHVIGISQQYSKVMITQLSIDGAADADLPVARDFAGTAQEADRDGLLFHPIAVSSTYDGTILILDSISQDNFAHTRIQAFDLLGRPVNAFLDPTDGSPSPFLELPNDVTYLDMIAVGNKKMTYMYVLYYEADGSAPSDYKMSIYQYGETAPTSNPLVTTEGVAASRIQVDMWHTMYSLNYEMITDGDGNPSGPSGTGVGPHGQTLPSVNAWTPPTPEH